jgi:5-methylcytosine-specific restriction endonuclease McrA
MHKGQRHTAESIEKMRLAQANNGGNASSIAGWNRGKNLSPEHRANIGKGNKEKRSGKTWEEIFGIEQARILRQMAQGRPATEQRKARAKASAERAWAEGRVVRRTLRGPDHPQWRGGSQGYRLSRPEWKARRKEIYERDNWTCQKCGKRCQGVRSKNRDRGRDIQCHHIISYIISRDDSPDNLITLCLSCHCAIERPRDPRPRPGAGAGTALGMIL